MNYQTVVTFDPNLRDVWFTDSDTLPTAMQGLAYEGVYIVTGAPVATVGKYLPGAIIRNAVDGTDYQMNGTTASPSFVLLESSASGFTLPLSETDSTTTAGNSLALIQNTVTTGTGLSQTMNGLTTGKGRSISHTTAVIANGGTLDNISSTSVDTSTTTGILQNLSSTASTAGTQRLLTASALTSGIADSVAVPALTTGIARKTTAAAATLTTGRYESYNDGALEVFGVGANGHLHSNQTTAPTISVGTANGITAAAVTAGSSDTAGNITTTGTNNNAGDTLLVVTFNKTYTVAPKAIHVFGTNVSGAKSQVFASVITASAFTVDIPASATAGATPAFSYIVIA